ncbi:MAG: hypothetical protein AAFN94_07395 [Pseudomonadota bacterium]
MRVLTVTVLTAALTLSACAAVRDSRVNPFNWFGRGQSEPVAQTPAEEVNPLIPVRNDRRARLFRRNAEPEYLGAPIDQVSGLIVERVPGGAMIRASGISPFQGAYDVRLTPANDDEEPVDGVLTYRLEVVQPFRARRGGPERVRTVTAARRLTDNQLAGVRTIRVEGVRNAQTSRRR